MASYKQPCIHCNDFIDRDSRICPSCGSRSPFGYKCPECLKEVTKDQAICSGCGRSLGTLCPTCLQPSFAAERCDKCGSSLLIKCTNPRCEEMQFFENDNCTACGKKIKK